MTSEILKLDMNGNVIDAYESVSLASRLNDIPRGSILNVANGRRSSANGFKWMYVSDYYFKFGMDAYNLARSKMRTGLQESIRRILKEEIESSLKVGNRVTIVANKKIGPMRWDRYGVPYIGVTFEKGKVIDTDAIYLGECSMGEVKILSHGHERCFESDEINIKVLNEAFKEKSWDDIRNMMNKKPKVSKEKVIKPIKQKTVKPKEDNYSWIRKGDMSELIDKKFKDKNNGNVYEILDVDSSKRIEFVKMDKHPEGYYYYNEDMDEPLQRMRIMQFIDSFKNGRYEFVDMDDINFFD